MTTLESPKIDISLSSGPARGMRALKAADLRKGGSSELPELIVEKLHTLDTDKFIERRLAGEVRPLLELLRDTLSGRYTELSLLAFADILLAMHHFIEVHDEIPDTHDGGLVDDLRKLASLHEAHGFEIEAYRRWKGRS